MFEDAPESLDDVELNKLAELTEEISFVDSYVPQEGTPEQWGWVIDNGRYLLRTGIHSDIYFVYTNK